MPCHVDRWALIRFRAHKSKDAEAGSWVDRGSCYPAPDGFPGGTPTEQCAVWGSNSSEGMLAAGEGHAQSIIPNLWRSTSVTTTMGRAGEREESLFALAREVQKRLSPLYHSSIGPGRVNERAPRFPSLAIIHPHHRPMRFNPPITDSNSPPQRIILELPCSEALQMYRPYGDTAEPAAGGRARRPSLHDRDPVHHRRCPKKGFVSRYLGSWPEIPIWRLGGTKMPAPPSVSHLQWLTNLATVLCGSLPLPRRGDILGGNILRHPSECRGHPAAHPPAPLAILMTRL